MTREEREAIREATRVKAWNKFHYKEMGGEGFTPYYHAMGEGVIDDPDATHEEVAWNWLLKASLGNWCPWACEIDSNWNRGRALSIADCVKDTGRDRRRIWDAFQSLKARGRVDMSDHKLRVIPHPEIASTGDGRKPSQADWKHFVQEVWKSEQSAWMEKRSELRREAEKMDEERRTAFLAWKAAGGKAPDKPVEIPDRNGTNSGQKQAKSRTPEPPEGGEDIGNSTRTRGVNINIKRESISQSVSKGTDRPTENSPVSEDAAERMEGFLLGPIPSGTRAAPRSLREKLPDENLPRSLCLQIASILGDAPLDLLGHRIHKRWDSITSFGLLLALASDVRKAWIREQQRTRQEGTPIAAAEPQTREQAIQYLVELMREVEEMPDSANAPGWRQDLFNAQKEDPDLYAEATRIHAGADHKSKGTS